MQKNTTQYVISGVVIVIVGALSFYGGMRYQMTKRPTFTQNQFGTRTGGMGNQIGPNGTQMGGQNRQGMMGAGRPIMGEILSKDDSSITVKMQDGGSKIIVLSEKTQIMAATQSDKSNLKVGDTVTTFGSQNSDGSVTAQNISIGALPIPSPNSETKK